MAYATPVRLNSIQGGLRGLRLAKNWSLDDVEKISNGRFVAGTVRSWETGQRTPSDLQDLLDLLALYGKTLVFADLEGARVTRTPREIVAFMRSMADDLEDAYTVRPIGTVDKKQRSRKDA